MKNKCISIAKLEQDSTNEDAALATDEMIAVSDGAGGGGLFAERWSRYLLEHLPAEPVKDADELDAWIGDIWEPFYNRCEADAKLLDGLSLNKFYDEGSFATLVAVWKIDDNLCKWISFGDSVAFHYNYSSKRLEHSFSSLADFDKPPFLINCKDELIKNGFRCGEFNTAADSVVFVASDALSHYIMMMYEIVNNSLFMNELALAESQHSKNENYIKAARAISHFDFEKDVLGKLINSIGHNTNFRRHIRSLIKNGLIAVDDYSMAVMGG